jgi:predicted dehydrogenase
VGVVGVGALGQHHARHLAAAHGAHLVGVFDTDRLRAEEVAQSCATRAFGDLDELLGRVEAVTIAVPTPMHAAVGCQALERGVAVLMEKPLAGSLEDADRLLQAAEASGMPLQVGHIERFNRAIRGAQAYLEGPRYLEMNRLAPFQPRGADVAVILDLMIHDLDLLLHLTGGGEATDVRASGVAVLTPHLDMANARVEFANGAVANVTASRVARERVRRLRLFQANGYFSLDLGSGQGEFMRLRPGFQPGAAVALEDIVERIPLTAPSADALGLELASFVQVLAGRPGTVVTGVEGRAALALALRVAGAVGRQPAVVGSS